MIKRLIGLAAVAAAGYYLTNKKKQNASGASTVRETIEVDVPVRTAYDQWTQFEEFPSFMDSVQEIKQLDDKRLHWKATVFGKPIEWDAEIVEQIPDQRIAWRSTTGTPNSGTVSFRSLSSERTRIVLEMSYTPTDAVESVGDALGAVRAEATANLKRFKEMIEARGHETGAWRGAISSEGRVTH
ncbi:MAG: SRPBCC family protein [Gammaproteobacteria bacterium]